MASFPKLIPAFTATVRTCIPRTPLSKSRRRLARPEPPCPSPVVASRVPSPIVASRVPSPVVASRVPAPASRPRSPSRASLSRVPRPGADLPPQIPISAPSQIGSARSGGLSHVSFLGEGGSVRSEPGYPLALDAVFVHGADYIRADPGGRHVRLEVSSLIKDTATGAFVRYNYTGTIPLAGPAGRVLGGQDGAGTTEFGEVCECLPTVRRCIWVTGGIWVLLKPQDVRRAGLTRRASYARHL